jgi:hypothetical protein
MKKILFAVAFAVFAHTQAFAIIGAGVHYIYNTGSLDADPKNGPVKEITIGEENKSIVVNQKSASGLQGIGFKAWIDFLPVVDIEGTLNVAATRYTTSLTIPTLTGDTTINLSYTPDAPYSMIFGNAEPLYGVVNGDLSVTYPFDLPIIRPYIGAGFSYFASIPIINASFTKKMLDPDLIEKLVVGNGEASEIGKALTEKLKEESYTTGIGGHIIAGFRIKPPVIPLAIYANGKFYFGGNTNSQFSQGFVLEVGGGLAI